MIRTKKIPLLLSLFAAAILFACTYTVSLAQGTVSATIEQYYESNGGKAVFGNLETSSETYAEYEKAMIFTSSEGTFSIRLPMLNTYIAAGGYGCLGAPSGEQYIEDGMVRQDFENGSLTCEDTIITDSLCSRRGRTYYFKNTLSDGNADTVIIYGRDTDETLVGDWDGDGLDTLCVRRGNTYYFSNSLTSGDAEFVITYGRAGDEVLVGDWDGDGCDTLCVRRNGTSYYFKNTLSDGSADSTITYGRAADEVLTGDWDGDNCDTLCVRRNGIYYYFKNTLSGGSADIAITYGRAADEVLAGDWDGDGCDSLCARRSGKTYYFNNTLSSGNADLVVNYGRASDTIYSGTWYELEKDADPDTTETAFNTSVSCSTLTLGLATGHVNTMSYRADALATYVDDDGNETQYCAYYGAYDEIVVAKRENGGDWTYRWTGMVGDSSDGHNTIAIAVDGNNCLHMAWSLHAGALTYAKAETPGSLDLEEQSMVGNKEDRVTYPSFYTLPDGDIFFLYRTGVSGDGDAVLNKYDADTWEWSRVQDCLISGEGEVSPYWQACVDSQGRLHISWVWRDTGTTETNHNMCYAVSTDSSGETFQMSSGSTYTLPITEQTAEVLEEIPQGSTLINQTSMTTDENDMPYILSYWRVGGSYGDDSAVVQYMVLRYTGSEWVTCNTGIRSTDFRLDGTGQTGKLCSRPQVAVSGSGDDAMVYILMHDTERDNKLAVASLSIDGDGLALQDITDITYSSIDGGFEPLYDVSLWKQTGKLQLFFQEGRSRSEVSENGYLTEMVYVVDISNLLTN